MSMRIWVPDAVAGIELVSVGNFTSTPASTTLKPLPVCWVSLFYRLQGRSCDWAHSFFEFGTCGID